MASRAWLALLMGLWSLHERNACLARVWLIVQSCPLLKAWQERADNLEAQRRSVVQRIMDRLMYDCDYGSLWLLGMSVLLCLAE